LVDSQVGYGWWWWLGGLEGKGRLGHNMSKSIKSETYFDPSTGLERRQRFGGAGVGSEPAKRLGSKREVWNGTAEKTAGGLTVDKLGKNKRGHIVSVAKYLQGRQRIAQLAQSPYFGRVKEVATARAGGAAASLPAAKAKRSPKPKSRAAGAFAPPTQYQPQPFAHQFPQFPQPMPHVHPYAQPHYPPMY
jgi:hypothetical protein